MKTCEKCIFLKYHLVHQDNFLAHMLCLVTYVTYFNKCSGPDVKLANLYSLLHKQDSPRNVRYPPVSNIFIYFSSIVDIKIGYLKMGVGLFNISYKTIYLR